MSDSIIAVENLGKRYRIRHQQEGGHRYVALRDVLASKLASPLRRFRQGVRPSTEDTEDFWALKDVSFEVKQGEAVGIIGRNGAGKSTLLKILSRITEPTEGRVTLRGRVASLLEVGTGFHPELTGRENIFLNGAILGMARAEIVRKFDEIVAFAEIETFLDTPVKRYSSGMYVRLAFAVAAHLEPEILIVDEVLAVGDAEFQKKCLGKMHEVGRGGRTVLFVSHNMEAILKLCNRALLLESGEVRSAGDVRTVSSTYLRGLLSRSKIVDLGEKSRLEPFAGKLRLVRAVPVGNCEGWTFQFGENVALDLSIDAQARTEKVELGIGLFSARGFEFASWTNACSAIQISLESGRNVLRIEYRDIALLPGQYFVGIGVRVQGRFEDYIPDAVAFEVVPSEKAARINAHTFGGVIVPTVRLSIRDQQPEYVGEHAKSYHAN